MKKILYVFICLVLAGCGERYDGFINVGESIIGSGKSIPLEDEMETLYIAQKASTQSQYEIYWNEWQITRETKEIDFSQYDTYFIFAYGSSSCPIVISQYRFEVDTLYVKLEKTGDESGNCTTDMAPFSYVLQTDKHDEVTNIVIIENRKEVNVELR